MEAIEFLREAQRMCNEYACYDGCPVYGACVFGGINAQSPERLEDIVATVETWIETHPIKTNAQKFKEVFGEKTIDQLALCETRTVGPNVPKLFTKPSSWWDEPYKEPEHE